MQYISQNKVNYFDSSTSIVFGSSVSSLNSTQDYICYSDNSFYNPSFYQGVLTTQTGKLFDIYSVNNTRYVNDVIFNVRPSFTCSDITLISDNHITFTVTYTLANNDSITKEYTYPLKKQFMNTYNLYDILQVNNTIKSFTISATSDIDLTLLAPIIMSEDRNSIVNMAVIFM